MNQKNGYPWEEEREERQESTQGRKKWTTFIFRPKELRLAFYTLTYSCNNPSWASVSCMTEERLSYPTRCRVPTEWGEEDGTLTDLISQRVFLWCGCAIGKWRKVPATLNWPEFKESSSCRKLVVAFCCIYFPNIKISSFVSPMFLMTKAYIVYQERPAGHWSQSKV